MKKLKKKEEQLKVSFDLKICGVPKPFPFEIAEKVSYSFVSIFRHIVQALLNKKLIIKEAEKKMKLEAKPLAEAKTSSETPKSKTEAAKSKIETPKTKTETPKVKTETTVAKSKTEAAKVKTETPKVRFELYVLISTR